MKTPNALLENVEAVAVAIVEHGTLEAAAKAIGCAVSTLRVWRQDKKIRERVRQLRQADSDARLARYRAKVQEIDEQLFALIADKDAAPTVRIGAINEFNKSFAALLVSADAADGAASVAAFEKSCGFDPT